MKQIKLKIKAGDLLESLGFTAYHYLSSIKFTAKDNLLWIEGRFNFDDTDNELDLILTTSCSTEGNPVDFSFVLQDYEIYYLVRSIYQVKNDYINFCEDESKHNHDINLDKYFWENEDIYLQIAQNYLEVGSHYLTSNFYKLSVENITYEIPAARKLTHLAFINPEDAKTLQDLAFATVKTSGEGLFPLPVPDKTREISLGFAHSRLFFSAIAPHFAFRSNVEQVMPDSLDKPGRWLNTKVQAFALLWFEVPELLPTGHQICKGLQISCDEQRLYFNTDYGYSVSVPYRETNNSQIAVMICKIERVEPVQVSIDKRYDQIESLFFDSEGLKLIGNYQDLQFYKKLIVTADTVCLYPKPNKGLGVLKMANDNEMYPFRSNSELHILCQTRSHNLEDHTESFAFSRDIEFQAVPSHFSQHSFASRQNLFKSYTDLKICWFSEVVDKGFQIYNSMKEIASELAAKYSELDDDSWIYRNWSDEANVDYLKRNLIELQLEEAVDDLTKAGIAYDLKHHNRVNLQPAWL